MAARATPPGTMNAVDQKNSVIADRPRIMATGAVHINSSTIDHVRDRPRDPDTRRPVTARRHQGTAHRAIGSVTSSGRWINSSVSSQNCGRK